MVCIYYYFARSIKYIFKKLQGIKIDLIALFSERWRRRHRVAERTTVSRSQRSGKFFFNDNDQNYQALVYWFVFTAFWFYLKNNFNQSFVTDIATQVDSLTWLCYTPTVVQPAFFVVLPTCLFFRCFVYYYI